MLKKLLSPIFTEFKKMPLRLKLVLAVILLFVIGTYIWDGLTLIFMGWFICIVAWLFYVGNQNYPFNKNGHRGR